MFLAQFSTKSDVEDVAFAAVDSDNKNADCKYVTFCIGILQKYGCFAGAKRCLHVNN